MKKWFLTQYESLIDLNSLTSIRVEKNGNLESKNKYLVVSDMFDVLAEFETLKEAIDYVKKIHLFLVAE